VPDATILTEGIVCSSDPALNLVARDAGGVWSGPGVVGDTFYPSLTGAGTHVITYSITDANGCSDFDESALTVATPDATITPVDTLCEDSQAITLTAHDQGGIWSGPGVVGNTFNPVLAGIGDHLIIYHIINPDCMDTDSTIITVMPNPVITINDVDPLFVNGPPVTLTATPAGGVWSGTGVNGSIFYPDAAGIGTHVITYEIPADRWGCRAKDSINVTVSMPPFPVADFEPDTVGCSPLAVQFINRSVYGESYVWDFGDGTFSTEENPTHTYYVPGNYIVKLIVYNLAGQTVHNGIITVFQNPSAIFNAYPTNVVNNEQVVVFYSYSYYADTWLWEFGDSQTSTEENPFHKYEAPGAYTVYLTVRSKDGCVDSTLLETPVIVDWKTGQLRFPNVFKWNEAGPTGGQWTEGVYAEMDFVFRPFFENVIEYRLQIFNRWGVLIYKSEDLHKGWDGYGDDGRLAAQGVYVWKVNGRYADGTYFDMAGDVTFLH
jgi:PKD repeat protein